MRPEAWKRVKEIFAEASALPPDERKTFVEDRLEGHPDLAAEVLSLLDAERLASEEGEHPALKRFLDAGTHLASPGRELGPYRLVEMLGEGGMGEVWLAHQEQPIERSVALKIIKLGMDTKQVVARFEAERQALAVMDHPHIAKVFDGGATSEGRPYFAMEVVQGRSITEYADHARLSTRGRVRLVIDVCRAVQHAHQKGVLHRDLKPSNLLVSEHDGVPVVKVIDFGIAKAIHGSATDSATRTAVDEVVGTPEYMSPEQADPSAPDIDTRTDVYSIGVVLYELLTGTRPHDFRGKTSWSALASLLVADAPKPSDQLTSETQVTVAGLRSSSAVELRRELVGDLDWVAMKAIDKDRERRYGTVQEFQLDLERFLANRPVLARPPTLAYQAKKFVRRHRTAVIASAAILLAVIGGGIASTIGLVRAQRAEALARAAEAERAVEAETAERVSDFMVGLFQAGSPDRARGSEVTALELLDRGAEQVRAELAGEPLVQARMLQTMGRAYRFLGYSDRGASLTAEAIERLEEDLGPDHPALATALLAYTPPGEADADRRSRVQRAHAIREAHLHPGDSLWLESFTMATLAAHGCTGGPDPARPEVQSPPFCPTEGSLSHLPDSLEVLERQVVGRSGPNSREAAVFRIGAANLLMADRMWAAARERFWGAGSVFLALGDTLKASEAANLYGTTFLMDSQYDSAAMHFRRAKGLLSEDDPSMAETRAMLELQLANLLLFEGERVREEGRIEETRELFQGAGAGYQNGVDILDHFELEAHETRLNLGNQLDWVYSVALPAVDSGRVDLPRAEVARRMMVEAREALWPEGHPDAVLARIDWAWAIWDQGGREAEVEEILTEALRRSLVFLDEGADERARLSFREAVEGFGHFLLNLQRRPIGVVEAQLLSRAPDEAARGDVLHALGNVAAGEGLDAESVDFWRRAVEARERSLGPDHVELAGVLVNLALYAFRQGRMEDAVRDYSRAAGIFETAGGDRTPVLLTALRGLERVHQRRGAWDDLREARRRTVEVIENRLGPEAREGNYPRMYLGLELLRDGQLEEARGLFEKSERLFEFYREPYNFAWARAGLGFVALEENRPDVAEEHFRAALAVWEAPEHQPAWWAEHAMVARELGLLAAAGGRLGEAEALFDQAAGVLANPLGPAALDRYWVPLSLEEARARLASARGAL